MRRSLGLPFLLLVASLTACQGLRPMTKPPLAAPVPQVDPAQRQAQARLCRQTSQTVSDELAALRKVERRLSRLKQQSPPGPSSAPPVWDEALEQRYSEQDRQLDRQRYERDLALWQQRHGDRQLEWERRHGLELADAQSELNARARGLRKLRRDLFNGPNSIEVNPATLAQIQDCDDTG
ncbi:MAG: hypothetical protein WAM11_14460 [Cyanobium sp.]